MTPTWSPCPRLPVLSVQGTVRYGPPAQLWCLEAQCSHNRSRGLGSLPPLNQAPLPPKEVPGGSVNRGEAGARTPKAIFSGRWEGRGSQHQFAPQSPHLPGSTTLAVVAGRAQGPLRVAQLCVCLEASALPQEPGVREQRSALPVDQHGRPLPTLQASLWVTALGDKPSQKSHPAHGSTPEPLPCGLARAA